MVMKMSNSFYNYSVAGSVVVGSSALNGAGRIIRQVSKLQNPPGIDLPDSASPPSNGKKSPPKNGNKKKDEIVSECVA